MDEVRAPASSSAVRVAVDVVDLRRVARLRRDCGPVLERRLLHPCERESAVPGRAGTDRQLAAALATKEAWVKSRGGRPPGWAFDCASFTPRVGSPLPDGVRVAVEHFRDDLGATSLEVGAVDDFAGSPSWAWHGLVDHWLVAAVLA